MHQRLMSAGTSPAVSTHEVDQHREKSRTHDAAFTGPLACLRSAMFDTGSHPASTGGEEMVRSTAALVLARGLVAGVAGYLVVSTFFALKNALQGRSPFFTAALLGEAAFYGGSSPTDLVVRPAPVLAFNGATCSRSS